MSISQLVIVSYPHTSGVYSLGFVHSKHVHCDHEAEVWDGFTECNSYGLTLALTGCYLSQVLGGVTTSSTLPLNHFSLNLTFVVTQLSL